MSVAPTALDALNRWAPIIWLKTNPYAYPALEVVHIIGIALVFGTLWIVDLAILGKLKGFEANLLARHVVPWTMAGFALAAVTGLTMFATNVGDLIANRAFVLKMCLLFAAGTNAAVLHGRGAIDGGSIFTRWQALLSIVIWVAIIACGRWIAYV